MYEKKYNYWTNVYWYLKVKGIFVLFWFHHPFGRPWEESACYSPIFFLRFFTKLVWNARCPVSMVSKGNREFWELLKDIVLLMRHIMWFSAAKAKVSIRCGENKEKGEEENQCDSYCSSCSKGMCAANIPLALTFLSTLCWIKANINWRIHFPFSLNKLAYLFPKLLARHYWKLFQL